MIQELSQKRKTLQLIFALQKTFPNMMKLQLFLFLKLMLLFQIATD